MNKILKYLKVFFITLFICILFLILTPLFNSNKLKTNFKDSISFLKMRTPYVNPRSNPNYYSYSKFVFEYLEYEFVSMSYNLNTNKPIQSIIEMNRARDLGLAYENYLTKNAKDKETIENYSRYWHGHTIFVRPLMCLFSIKYIYIINSVIFILLMIILFYEIYKIDKKMYAAFVIGNIMINFYIIPTSIEYFFAFLIAYILSYILLKLYKKNRKIIYNLMIVSGVLTCFFDCLSCETITVTIPLFIYIFLEYKNNKKIKFKDIFELCLLWILSYASTFIIKWGIDFIHYGSKALTEIGSNASLRLISKSQNIFKVIASSIVESWSCVLPFSLFKYRLAYIFLFIIIALDHYKYNYKKKEKKYFNYMLLISLIPFIRYIVLSSHSQYHFLFTYRAFLPFIIFIIYIYIDIIFKKYINYKFKKINKK